MLLYVVAKAPEAEGRELRPFPRLGPDYRCTKSKSAPDRPAPWRRRCGAPHLCAPETLHMSLARRLRLLRIRGAVCAHPPPFSWPAGSDAAQMAAAGPFRVL